MKGKIIAVIVTAGGLGVMALLLSSRAAQAPPLPVYEAEYRTISARTGGILLEDLVGQMADGTLLTKFTVYAGPKPRIERVIYDYVGQVLYSVNDGIGMVKAISMKTPPPSRLQASDPGRDCVLSYAGDRDDQSTVLRHEKILGHSAVVLLESSGSGLERTVWRATDFHCVQLRSEARSGELLSTRELVALRTQTTPNLYKIPESFDKVDPVEYSRRLMIYNGEDPEQASPGTRAEREWEMAKYIPGFQIPERFLLKCCK